MAEALLSAYDGLVCDLDGVVYAGPSAVPHAVEALDQAARRGRTVLYATNNASRPPRDVAAHLRDLGLSVEDAEVVNSSMAAAHVLRGDHEPGSTVLAVGGEGVALALDAQGFEVLLPADVAHEGSPAPVAVVQGYGPDVKAADLAEAAYAIQGGARWVATNTDATLPTNRGVAPGNGSLIGAVRLAVDVDPVVAGKPMPVMYDMAAQRMGVEPSRVLAIGDRLETDIEGACRGGYDNVLVLTGVHGLADAAAAPSGRRPTYVLADLRGLHEAYEVREVPVANADAPRSGVDDMAGARGLLAQLWRDVDAGIITAEDAAEHMAAATKALS